MAFIDGCHDTRYIINDTLKVLPLMRQHGFLIWHDFNPRLTHQFPWLNKVIAGVKALYAGGHLSQPTLYLRNSFTAVHRL
jgi:hypothetical protein